LQINLCTIQFDRSSGNPEINLDKMANWLNEVSSEVDIILLPEAWLGPLVIGYDFHLSVLRTLQNLLPAENVLLVSGAQYVRQTASVVVSTGAFIKKKQIIHYDKHFPSHAIGERDFIAPGSRLPVVDSGEIKSGTVVCVDLFYPEICRRHALRGASIVFNPANIPAERMGLWHHIGITRAAENTVFLAMANNARTSYPDGREVAGRSFVAGPDGMFFRDLGQTPGIYYTTLNLSLIEQVRNRWKYLEDIESRYPNLSGDVNA